MNIINKVHVTNKGKITFCGLLTIAFIILKLIGVISWSWLWVLAPIWMPFVIKLVLIVFVLFCAALLN